MLFIFVIDTSFSMNQCTEKGISIFDCAKSGVEGFIRTRTKAVSRATDRYALITYRNNVPTLQVTVCDSPTDFLETLRNLKALDLSIPASVISSSSELVQQALALGQNKPPSAMHYIPRPDAASALVFFTDGGVEPPLEGIRTLAGMASPQAWDQRVYCFLLRLGASAPAPTVPPATLPTANELLAQLSGGRYSGLRYPSSHHQPHFPPIGSSGRCRCVPVALLYPVRVDRSFSLSLSLSLSISPFLSPPHPNPPPPCGQDSDRWWPLPSSAWADPIQPPGSNNPRPHTPPPSATPPTATTATPSWLPELYFVARGVPVQHEAEDCPCDKYEVEPGQPLLGALCHSCPAKGTGWQVYARTHQGDFLPCGYLRPSAQHTSPLLMMLPFDYPIFFSVVAQLRRAGAGDVLGQRRLEGYIRRCPLNYMPALASALRVLQITTTPPLLQERLELYRRLQCPACATPSPPPPPAPQQSSGARLLDALRAHPAAQRSARSIAGLIPIRAAMGLPPGSEPLWSPNSNSNSNSKNTREEPPADGAVAAARCPLAIPRHVIGDPHLARFFAPVLAAPPPGATSSSPPPSFLAATSTATATADGSPTPPPSSPATASATSVVAVTGRPQAICPSALLAGAAVDLTPVVNSWRDAVERVMKLPTSMSAYEEAFANRRKKAVPLRDPNFGDEGWPPSAALAGRPRSFFGVPAALLTSAPVDEPLQPILGEEAPFDATANNGGIAVPPPIQGTRVAPSPVPAPPAISQPPIPSEVAASTPSPPLPAHTPPSSSPGGISYAALMEMHRASVVRILGLFEDADLTPVLPAKRPAPAATPGVIPTKSRVDEAERKAMLRQELTTIGGDFFQQTYLRARLLQTAKRAGAFWAISVLGIL
ncbi:putative integrator complex subunit 6 [Paratrimastix pyriformis]|uniref:Integrator complex subunit 6 n=1 Tax=Paratrimastix pyriformis TaxID=342808 RepID=A0ABQ8ULN9_9EUKA|nr:putative integrator complex subunit 6 [Paratrimastix pyriformis]